MFVWPGCVQTGLLHCKYMNLGNLTTMVSGPSLKLFQIPSHKELKNMLLSIVGRFLSFHLTKLYMFWRVQGYYDFTRLQLGDCSARENCYKPEIILFTTLHFNDFLRTFILIQFHVSSIPFYFKNKRFLWAFLELINVNKNSHMDT